MLYLDWESYIDADILKRTIGRSFGIGSATGLFQGDIEGISTYNDENDVSKLQLMGSKIRHQI